MLHFDRPSCLQVYFRYPSPAASDGDQRSVSHQLVQCVYKKTSYPSPIQVCYPFTLELMSSSWFSRLSYLNLHFCAAPEGGGNKVLGPRRRVRPPLRLPGRTVWVEGRRRGLRLRLFPNHGQRRRFLELLRRLSPGPLRGRGRKKKEMGQWMDKWVGSRLLNSRWLEKKGSFRQSCGMSACVSDPQCLLGRIHWRMEGFAWVNAARGWGEREKKEWICLPYSPLSENQTPLRARYTNIHVQSLENKCENSSFLLIFWGRKLLFDVKERSKPQKSI